MNNSNVKRIGAIIGIILIASMYAVSLIFALFSSPAAPGLFLTAIFSTVIIPIMIYGFIATYKYVHRNDRPKQTTKDGSKDDEDTEA